MTRDEILNKAAQAMLAKHDPGHARSRTGAIEDERRWYQISLKMYRDRFTTGLDAVEDDIRADAARAERERIVAWLRDDEGSPAARTFAYVIESGVGS